MHKKFDSSVVEKKWREIWKEEGIYNVGERDSSKEKEYVLVEWPYPSGNLHIGHWYAFAVPDIYVRYKRMMGKQVLFPMGFDAFGLPAENAAIKHGKDPKAWTNQNISYMKDQLESMGNAFSWDKTTSSTDPKYYKWTQWMFTQFFEKGLAYRGKGVVNWCPGCNTMIANEQVVSGNHGDECERCGHAIEKREMPQWMLGISKYADRLIDDLDNLDEWPEHIKEAQRQWIGRSKGAEIDFKLNLPAYSGKVLFASNNKGKLARMRKLVGETDLDIELISPEEAGITDTEVSEDQFDLVSNAKKKALHFAEYTDLPVLADDTGFFIDGEKLDPVTVKRNALAGINEKDLSVEEVGVKMVEYYAEIAKKRGGEVEAEWRNVLCLIVNGQTFTAEGVRPVVLTDKTVGEYDPYLPVRALYKAKATGKYALTHSEEEEMMELSPITEALKKVFTPSVTVFTTRPDTLYGATYMVLAPEHALVTANKDQIQNWPAVEAYINETKQKDEQDRLDATKEKTGVKLEGITATNPASDEEIPVYIADYVLGGYGTGAIMAVPAHDERDFAFAKKFGAQIKSVISPKEIFYAGALLESKQRPGSYILQLRTSEFKTFPNQIAFFGGKVEKNESPEECIVREINEEIEVKLDRKDFSETHTFVGLPNNGMITAIVKDVDESSLVCHEGEVVVLTVEEILTDPRVLGTVKEYVENHIVKSEIGTDAGILIESAEFSGMDSEEAKVAITEKVGGRMTSTYRLRDWSVGRQRYWGTPIPIVYDPEGKAHVVPKEHLPWALPEDVDFTPTGEPPLAKSAELKKRTEEIFGKGWTPEVETMDTFVDSSWYFLRYLDNHNEEELSSLVRQREWMSIDTYFGGAEHTTMHLLYSRFWQKALFDLGLVTETEPYKQRVNRGLILGPDGNKMSKSKGNVIDPDEQVAQVGSDTVKMYLAFMGPYEGANYPFDLGGVAGIRRFLERVNGLSEHVAENEDTDTLRLLHKTIKKVRADIQNFKFNTAISAMMVFVNQVEKTNLSQNSYLTFLRLLAPFAPHLTAELWQEAKMKESIHLAEYPLEDESLAKDDTVTIGVQVNGKLRGDISLAPDADEATAKEAVANNSDIQKHIQDGEMVKFIYVPGRIVNVVVK